MKENKAFRKKQLKSRQALHRIFLKPQYKVYRGASILYFNTSFFWRSLFFKNISTSRLEPTNGKQCCLPPLTFKISLKAIKLTFIRHLTLINRNLLKQKIIIIIMIIIIIIIIKNSLLCWIKFKQFHTFSAYSKLSCIFILYLHFSL